MPRKKTQNPTAIDISEGNPVKPLTYKATRSFIDQPLTPVSQGEFIELKEEFQGLKRAAQLAGEEYALREEIYKTQSKGIKAETAKLAVETTLEGWKQEGLRLQQAQTKTAIEGVHLATVRRDLEGYQTEAGLKSEAWDIKLDGLKNDVEHARWLAHERRTKLLQQREEANR